MPVCYHRDAVLGEAADALVKKHLPQKDLRNTGSGRRRGSKIKGGLSTVWPGDTYPDIVS